MDCCRLLSSIRRSNISWSSAINHSLAKRLAKRATRIPESRSFTLLRFSPWTTSRWRVCVARKTARLRWRWIWSSAATRMRLFPPATPAASWPLPRSSCAPCRESIAPVLPRSARGTTATLSCSTPVPVWTANPGISCTTPSWATFTPGKYWAFPDQGWAC